jgi:hypothetical protein
LRVKPDFARAFKLIWAVQSFLQKFFHFLFSEIVFTLVHPAPARGAYASSRTWSGNAVDAMAPTDERHFLRTAKSCGPGAPRQALSFARNDARATVAIKLVHRGEHEVSRKTIAQGRPECIRLYLWSTRSSRNFFARGPRVHVATRSSLRPLVQGGYERMQSSGASGRENEHAWLLREYFLGICCPLLVLDP